MSSDLVATWDISLPSGKHNIEFEHGTTSGKRVIRVDGKEIKREEWMFKLVGKEHFKIGQNTCVISIDACSGFAYEYTLSVNGKSLKKFCENQSKIMKCWYYIVDPKRTTIYRIVLEKDTLDVWVNGKVVDTAREFTDEGTETHFALSDHTSACIRAVSSGNKRIGIIHQLFVNEQEVPESSELDASKLS